MTVAPMHGTLELPPHIRDEMVAHARSDTPFETCGLLAADDEGRLVRHWPIPNADRSMTWFRMEPKAQLKAMREMDDEDLEWAAIWHCHTHTEAYPSPTDIEQSAYWPGIVAIIVSLQDPDPVIRAYDITDGQVSERVLTVAQEAQPQGPR
ncbi:Mov34/MPN/PAD-1 family protein [Euzebya rosea]|uniref:Mov34/MPN/PAD-1 family protein n=1 Tax=Euzebya rosea TaxID=2052804 RepID=UPI00196A72E4|nr:M67 family metallopeptidase [Euzebya rosea]